MNFFPKESSTIFKVNVEGTRNLATVARDNNVTRFIYVSSTEAMGATDGHTGEESGPLRPSSGTHDL